MFNSARDNQFKFEFPRTFIPEEIANKYRPFVNKMPGAMIKEPIDIFNYTIQSINLPGPSFDTITQNDYPGNTRHFRNSLPVQELRDRSFTVTLQGISGYVNYWMAIDTFEYYYELSGKQPYVPSGPGIQMYDSDGNLFVTTKLDKMVFNSVSSLDLNFSSNTVDFKTFDLEFTYNILEVVVNLS